MNREPRIDAYIANARPFARPILEKVRERVHAVVPGVEEAMKWSAPGFTLKGKILLMMAAFKGHAALNFWRGQEIGDALPKAGAMGQFGQLTSVSDLPPVKKASLALQADKKASFGMIIKVMDALKLAGVRNLPAFTREEK